MIPLLHYLYISIALFCIGLTVVVSRKNIVMILMGIELILNAANINLVAFSHQDSHLKGQMFALFVIVVAVAEISIALAILIKLYGYFNSPNIDAIPKQN